jgi:hypothetical protein
MLLQTLEITQGVEIDATLLVKTLAQLELANNGPQFEQELAIKAIQCRELLAPVPDYETAARAAGWKTADLTPGMLVKPITGQAMAAEAPTWKMACEMDSLEAPTVPVLHVYVTTPRLGGMLELMGERIDQDMFGWFMWADFREEQQHKYLLKAMGGIYEHSDVWRNAVESYLRRLDAIKNTP